MADPGGPIGVDMSEWPSPGHGTDRNLDQRRFGVSTSDDYEQGQ
jgi:hypothetical protein